MEKEKTVRSFAEKIASTGPVHPIALMDKVPEVFAQGITKRELFAALAMQGLVTIYDDSGEASTWATHIAQDSVRLADALLAELKQDA